MRHAAVVATFVGAVVGASASGALAAPVTLGYPLDLFPVPVAKFDTTLGTLLRVDISVSTFLGAINPFSSGVPTSDTCTAVFTGASIAISAPGTPTLLTIDGAGNTSGPCDRFEFGIGKQGATTVDPSFFGAFSSVGFSPITMNVALIVGTATFTRGSQTLTTTDVFWHPGLTRGTLSYTYCPVGEDCPTTPPPPPPSVPEPTTVVTLSLGLASLLARRRTRR